MKVLLFIVWASLLGSSFLVLKATNFTLGQFGIPTKINSEHHFATAFAFFFEGVFLGIWNVIYLPALYSYYTGETYISVDIVVSDFIDKLKE